MNRKRQRTGDRADEPLRERTRGDREPKGLRARARGAVLASTRVGAQRVARALVRIVRHAAAAFGVAVLVGGCGASAPEAARRTLEGVARVSAQVDGELARQRRSTSAAIVADPSATREQHAEAMAPYDEALERSHALREAQLAAEAGLDAVEAGQSSDWVRAVACVVELLSRFVESASRLVNVPREVAVLLETLSMLAPGHCTATGEGRASDE